MSRSNYSDDLEQWTLIRWRGAVKSAICGKRGQAFLREILSALDQLEQKQLIAHELKTTDGVCAIGAVAIKRNKDVSGIDPENYVAIANEFGISCALAQEIMFENDEAVYGEELPEARFKRMRQWIVEHIKP